MQALPYLTNSRLEWKENIPYLRPKRPKLTSNFLLTWLKDLTLWGRKFLYSSCKEVPPLPLLVGLDTHWPLLTIIHSSGAKYTEVIRFKRDSSTVLFCMMVMLVVSSCHNRPHFWWLHLFFFAILPSHGVASSAKLFPIQHVFFFFSNDLIADLKTGIAIILTDDFPHFSVAVLLRVNVVSLPFLLLSIEYRVTIWKERQTDRQTDAHTDNQT